MQPAAAETTSLRTASSRGGPPAGEWDERWRSAEAAAQRAIDATLADESVSGGGLSEPALGRLLLSLVPSRAVVVAASSMPIRDLEWFTPVLPDPPRVVANRGANGIDGVCSTARGVATGGSPTVGVVGDLAFLHDVSALVSPLGGAPASCTLVVVDNAGGGIFNFLPQADVLEGSRFEALFGTPQTASVTDVARGFGLAVAEATTEAALEAALRERVGSPGLSVVRVPTPERSENVALHGRIESAVSAAVRSAIAP